MSAPWHNLPTRAGRDLIATIRFARSICTVTRQIPKPWRSWAATMAPVLLLFALMSAVEDEAMALAGAYNALPLLLRGRGGLFRSGA
jgi:hypothetical protein